MLPEEQELNRLESEQATLEDQVATAELTLETLKARNRAVSASLLSNSWAALCGAGSVGCTNRQGRSRTRPGQCRSASTGRSR